MSNTEFLQLGIPAAYVALGIDPQELFELQVSRYEPGHWQGSPTSAAG